MQYTPPPQFCFKEMPQGLLVMIDLFIFRIFLKIYIINSVATELKFATIHFWLIGKGGVDQSFYSMTLQVQRMLTKTI